MTTSSTSRSAVYPASFKWIDIRSDLFATVFCFAAQAILRIASSLILTRILAPEAYGVIVILMSILFVVEMLADLGLTLFVVRDASAENQVLLNTAWTLRLGRAILNYLIILLCAPAIALLYDVPSLVTPLRIFALWFVIAGLESMSFPLATRRRMSRITMYSELAATITSTAFTIVYCSLSRDYWGMIYGTLLNRALITLLSYRIFPESRPRLQIDGNAARQILKFSRITMSSSILTLALTQFDKILFLRLFNLQLLGIYGLASNFAAQIEGLITAISQKVLYPRCAQVYRDDPGSTAARYYSENTRLFISMLIIPAAVGGAAPLIINLLYPQRYQQAAFVLGALMIRASLLALGSASEDLLAAAGETQVFLVGNVYRAVAVVFGSLFGYLIYGFSGFVIALGLSGLPPLLYYYWLQQRRGYLVLQYELYKVGLISVVALCAWTASAFFLAHFPDAHLHLHF